MRNAALSCVLGLLLCSCLVAEPDPSFVDPESANGLALSYLIRSSQVVLGGSWDSLTHSTPNPFTGTASNRMNYALFTFQNKLWIIGGGGDDAWNSPDGFTWTQTSGAVSGSSLSNAAGIATASAMFAVGDGTNVRSSSNGTGTWPVVGNLPGPIITSSAVRMLVFKSQLWVITAGGAVYSSANAGVTWGTVVTGAPFANSNSSLRAAVFKGELLVANGYQLFSSSDGNTWNQISSFPSTGSTGLDFAQLDSRLWDLGTLYFSKHSSDGRTWTGISNPVANFQCSPSGAQTRGVAFSQRLWLLGGTRSCRSMVTGTGTDGAGAADGSL